MLLSFDTWGFSYVIYPFPLHLLIVWSPLKNTYCVFINYLKYTDCWALYITLIAHLLFLGVNNVYISLIFLNPHMSFNNFENHFYILSDNPSGSLFSPEDPLLEPSVLLLQFGLVVLQACCPILVWSSPQEFPLPHSWVGPPDFWIPFLHFPWFVSLFRWSIFSRSLLKNSERPVQFYFLIFNFLAMPHGMWDPSSPTRGRTHTPCSGRAES